MASLYVCLDFLAVSVSAPFGNDLKISISGLPVIIVAVFCAPGGVPQQALSVPSLVKSLIVTLLNTGALLHDAMIYGYTTYYAVLVAVPMRIVAGILTALVFSLMLPTIIHSLNHHVNV